MGHTNHFAFVDTSLRTVVCYPAARTAVQVVAEVIEGLLGSDPAVSTYTRAVARLPIGNIDTCRPPEPLAKPKLGNQV